MRDKVGLAALAIVLVVVWGAGFLWFRGQGSSHATTAVTARTAASSSIAVSPSSTPSLTNVPIGTAAPPVSLFTGRAAPLDTKKVVDANPVAPRPRPVVLPPVADFTMASFNILGSTHTGKGGANAGMAPGAERVNGVISVLAQHGISVVGLQEFQPNQRAAFGARAPGWQMWPGLSMGRRAGENSVAWRSDTWELVQTNLIDIPYFHGRIRPMPYVQLRHRATGITAYFSTFHNPANVYGPAQRFRNEATSREIGLFNRLHATGIPQLVTGDMNERSEYFCRVTGSTPLKAAAGGSNSGGCAPPQPTQIDWILGSPDLTFSDYVIDRSPTVRRTTDHPVIVTKVSIDALKYPRSYQPPG